jgi:hypothetical protein
MLGDLGVSTLRSIKTMTQFSSLFWASNQPCYLLQCSGTTLRVCLRRPLVFLVVPTCWETRFSSRRYSTYIFPLLLFWTIILAILPAMMLGYYSWVHLRCPLNFFIVVSIYWKPASYRSSLDLSSFGKTINRLATTLICFFFLFWTDVHAIQPVDSSMTSPWPF